ncbi:MAG: DinB family protein [Dehalococcoidia bacterium]|nr:DinB family protein [Dehalococcoidia bacterium]
MAGSARDSLRALLDGARADLLAAIEGLTPEQMTVPVIEDWSAKDILAHVSAWEVQIVPDLERVRDEFAPALAHFREQDVDRWNELMMGLRRTFPLSQVLHELGHWRQEVLRRLDELEERHLSSGFVPAICAIASGHDRDHAGQIREWRKREGI